MKKLFLLTLVLLSACQASEKITVASTYEIRLAGKAPNIAHATLHLTDNAISERTLYLRGNMMGVPSQISEVMCDENELVQNENLTWSVPSECRAANWTITFATHTTSPYQPSQQQSLFTQPNWWLVSGPSSILRLSGSDKDIKTIRFTLPDDTHISHHLQGTNEPPNYFNLGNAPSLSVSNSVDSLNYIGDDLDTVLSIINPEDHLKAIEYLRSVLGASARTVEKLDVNWFGAPRERREASGAAGYDTILANYIVSNDTPKREEQLLSLMLIFHEQFHQLDSAAHPVWMAESLANYYALKALRKIYPEDEAVNLVWGRFIDIDRPINISLRQIQSEISNDNNRQNYGLLYTQGASFWYELDVAIQKHSSGQNTLDNLIFKMAALDLEPGEEAWEAIKPLFTSIPASTLSTIESKYIY